MADEDFDDFEDASDDEPETPQNTTAAAAEWTPLDRDALAARLTEYYAGLSIEAMTPALVQKATGAYLAHQPLLHQRLLEKYKAPLFNPAPPPPPEPKRGFFCKGKTYTGEVKPFELPFARWKRLSLEESDEAGCKNGYSETPFATFKLRGKNYLEDSQKFPSKSPAFALAGAGAVITKEPLTHCALNLPPLKKWIEENADGCESFFIFSWMIPGPPFFSVVQVFYRKLPRGEDKDFDTNFDRFCDGDDAFRNTKFKYKTHMTKCPMMVGGVIRGVGGERPVLIGNKLKCLYHRGKNYIEVNCDVSSSRIARRITGACLRHGGPELVIDKGYIIEGHGKDELPERLLASIRFAKINVDEVSTDYTDIENPTTFKDGSASITNWS